VKRSSSAAAKSFPSFIKQAEESWNTALMPRMYIRIKGFKNFDLPVMVE
jgi:hypothetical protein